MVRFRFALDPLLKTRGRHEQAIQREVADLERERLAMEDRIRRKQRLFAEGRDARRDSLTGTLNIDALRGHAGSALRVMRDTQRDVLELAGVHRRLDLARARLIEATRARRAVELLRERRYEAWRRDHERRETAAQDELATIAAGRKEMAS
jgi:flagellar FliJ protein